MQHKSCFEAVNWTLNDICHVSDSSLFSNIPTVLSGDFAQILPVVSQVQGRLLYKLVFIIVLSGTACKY